jgi:hypothetical protein
VHPALISPCEDDPKPAEKQASVDMRHIWTVLQFTCLHPDFIGPCDDPDTAEQQASLQLLHQLQAADAQVLLPPGQQAMEVEPLGRTGSMEGAAPAVAYPQVVQEPAECPPETGVDQAAKALAAVFLPVAQSSQWVQASGSSRQQALCLPVAQSSSQWAQAGGSSSSSLGRATASSSDGGADAAVAAAAPAAVLGAAGVSGGSEQPASMESAFGVPAPGAGAAGAAASSQASFAATAVTAECVPLLQQAPVAADTQMSVAMSEGSIGDVTVHGAAATWQADVALTQKAAPLLGSSSDGRSRLVEVLDPGSAIGSVAQPGMVAKVRSQAQAGTLEEHVTMDTFYIYIGVK